MTLATEPSSWTRIGAPRRQPRGPDASPRLPRGGEARREAILAAAEALFLEEGLEGASMSKLAHRIGGSKSTLYNYFQSKEEIFAACVLSWRASQLKGLSALTSQSDDPRRALTEFGAVYLRELLGDEAVRRLRLVAAEAERAPRLARLYRDALTEAAASRLAWAIEHWTDIHELYAPDPALAARQFLALCQGPHLTARLLGHEREPSEAQVLAAVGEAVGAFIRAFHPHATLGGRRMAILRWRGG